MRLLTKNTLVYLAAAIFVFVSGGFVFYYQLNTIISAEATEDLYLKKEQVLSFIDSNKQLPQPGWLNETISFTPAKGPVSESIKDTDIFNETEKEMLPYRELIFPVSLAGSSYIAEIRKPMFESEDLVEAIYATLIIISVALLVVMLSLNYFFSRSTWKPFFKTIDQLGDYDIDKHPVLKTEQSNIKEFRQLNAAVEKMTAKISTDFQNLKTFTENASHEIQTPLAIIKTKLELLIQSKQNQEEDMRVIQSVYEAANRLSKLNQALLLLTKIENHQFTHKEQVEINKLLDKHLLNYSELIEAKGIHLISHMEEPVSILANPSLIDMLLANLLSNAIKHNQAGGTIDISLTTNRLVISNTGAPLNSAPDQLFERFRKDHAASDSLGLGLSIVKKITDTEQLAIKYTYQQNRHTMELQF